MTTHHSSVQHIEMDQPMTEKKTVFHKENQSSGMDPDDAAFLARFSKEQQRKTIRKVDVSLPYSLK